MANEVKNFTVPSFFAPKHDELRGVSDDSHHPPFTLGEHNDIDHTDIPGVPDLDLIKKLDIQKLVQENENYRNTLWVHDQIQKGKILLKIIQENSHISKGGIKVLDRNITLKKYHKTMSEATAVFNYSAWEGYYAVRKINGKYFAKKFKRNAGQERDKYNHYEFFYDTNPQVDNKSFLFFKNNIIQMGIYFFSDDHPFFLNNLVEYELRLKYCPGSYVRLATPPTVYEVEDWSGDEEPEEKIARPIPKVFSTTIGKPGLYEEIPSMLVINGVVDHIEYNEGKYKSVFFRYKPGVISYNKNFMKKELQFKIEYR